MRDTQQQRLARCIEFLRPIAHTATEEAREAHWIGARNADPDQGPSYCRECCDALVEKLNTEHPEHEYLRDGGWGYDADGLECCDSCGKQLNVFLTSYGIEQELDNWSGSKIMLRGKRAPYLAFDLLNLLECADMRDLTSQTYLHGYQLDQAKNIQLGVHRLTRRIDAIRRRAAAEFSITPKEQS